jgi:hypothetical protein
MALANSKDKDEQTRQERARAAIDAYKPKYDDLSAAVRKGRHLDVDAVLARSLPKTISQPGAKPLKVLTT